MLSGWQRISGRDDFNVVPNSSPSIVGDEVEVVPTRLEAASFAQSTGPPFIDVRGRGRDCGRIRCVVIRETVLRNICRARRKTAQSMFTFPLTIDRSGVMASCRTSRIAFYDER